MLIGALFAAPGSAHSDDGSQAAGSPSAKPDAPFHIPAPLPLPRRAVDMVGAVQSDYYARPASSGTFGLRLGLGVAGRVTVDPGAAFALDVFFSPLLGLGRGRMHPLLAPLLGYSLSAAYGHLGVVGLGLGLRDHSGVIVLIPSFVFGQERDGSALGVRASLLVQPEKLRFIYFEAAYQWLSVSDAAAHDLRGTVGVDVVRAIFGKRSRVYGEPSPQEW